ncbi:MAG TPA: class I SAM-dependent methyltransferase, partial [Campylobacterales bacterium]|nr:class I SAM-dependent methyltransferase [Campylobacterales bacterium]
MNNFFDKSDMSAADAQYEAQKIAFAPIVFQAVRVMIECGILKLLDKNRKGISIQDIADRLKMTTYAVTVLMETGLSAGVVKNEHGLYCSTKIGYFLLNDPMTIVNMDYNHYVNYLGLYSLDEALAKSKPTGLTAFGDWETIYSGLSSLPEKVKNAWFSFDHFYSDAAFPMALEIVLRNKPTKILDIGGNTGKFSLLCAQTIQECHLTIVDIPEQIATACEIIAGAGLEERIDTFAANMLERSTILPDGYDTVWMSQFLDCFGLDDVIAILSKVYKHIDENAKVYILEPIWDRQKYETSAYCLINTSPYFTVMANGKSKMFNFKELSSCIE